MASLPPTGWTPPPRAVTPSSRLEPEGSAGLQGKNPVWAAIKGAWSGGSSQVRAAIVAAVVAMVLLLLLSPVLLLVFLLGLLIIAAVSKARSAQR